MSSVNLTNLTNGLQPFKKRNLYTYAELDPDLEVHVPDVTGVGNHLEAASDLLPLLAGQVVLQVEHGLMETFISKYHQ